MSGCGVRLFTNIVDVECDEDATEMAGHLVSQDLLPSKPLETRPPRPSLVGSQPYCRVDEKRAERVTQITSSSCWAASAEATLRFHTDSIHPRQCEILSDIMGKDIEGNLDCCGNKNQGNCQRNGLPSWAFEEYGFNWLMVEGPLEREKLAAQLCINGPFIFILRYSGGGGHSFVVSDYFYDEDTKELLLWVHDHSSDLNGPDSTELSASRYHLWTYEDYKAGRWGGEVHTHDVNYVYITSPTER